ncbi:LysM peptidoglycan-binding domain-containing protein [Bacillus sp. Marseille-P3661]|uniref:LysM peptidoglycan-binding domain-containing protein n=1 Tax=Bacillus sp. Marseille-P3661 TaxID=1936234 RepID=UPI0015E18E0B|nr:LysM peptidoglycan-binding domain-containing protein [Bacillus sp. Marseille-P3661]
MDLFFRHKIVETQDGHAIILYINPNKYEFAQELGERVREGTPKSIESQVQQYIRNRVASNVQARLVKIMFGSILIATLTLNHQSSTLAAENSNNGAITEQSNDVIINIDGEPTTFSQPPIIKDGVTYIPIRGVAEKLGASVWWNGDSKTVGINSGNTRIAFTVGSTVANVNSEKLNVPPSILVNGTVMVPLRFVSTALGLNVDWNGETRTVNIVSPNSQKTHQVVNGDSLWGISQRYGISVNDIKTMNNLTSDHISVGQTLNIPQSIPKQSETPGLTTSKVANQTTSDLQYQVMTGDTLYSLANKFNTTVAQIKQDNKLTNDALFVGQKLNIQTDSALSTPNGTSVPSTYIVTSGDSLSAIARKFNISVSNIKEWNQLTKDTIYVGQVLKLTNDKLNPAPTTTNSQTQTTGTASITYDTHIIQKGDNMWNLSVKYGVPMSELLKTNGMTQSSPLSIGQIIKVPVHNIPVQKTVSAKHGEYLDWWTEAQYVFGIGKVAKVTDFQTGKSFKVKRTTGANHADCEPLTATDAATMKQVWGGAWSWKTRPVIVEVDGRKIAASMSAMPHDVQYIADNNFEGHFDIHFKNSTRHKDGKVDTDHQAKIKVAAGT